MSEGFNATQREIEILEALTENARLRKALEKIAKDPPSTLDEPDLDWEVIQKIRAIARAAISSGIRNPET